MVKKHSLFEGTGEPQTRYYRSSYISGMEKEEKHRDDRARKARSSLKYNYGDQYCAVNSWSPSASRSAYTYAPESIQATWTGIRPQYNQYSGSFMRSPYQGYSSHVYKGHLEAYF